MVQGGIERTCLKEVRSDHAYLNVTPFLSYMPASFTNAITATSSILTLVFYTLIVTFRRHVHEQQQLNADL
jgi:hypothetical protein